MIKVVKKIDQLVVEDVPWFIPVINPKNYIYKRIGKKGVFKRIYIRQKRRN